MSQTPYGETNLSSYGTDAYNTPSLPDLEEPETDSDDLPEDTIDGPADSAGTDEDDSEDSGTETSTAPGSKAAAAAKPNRAFIRKVAVKSLEVETASDSVKSLAAALLGCSEDTIELTVAIMTAGRTAVQPLTDIAEVLEALAEEPWEAGIIAAAMDAGRQKAVWSVLQARGTAGATPLPKALAKAAKLIVKAINGLDATDKSGLTAAGELLKRS